MSTFAKHGIRLVAAIIFIAAFVVPTCAQKKGLAKGVKAAFGKKPPLMGAAPAIHPNVPLLPSAWAGVDVSATHVAPMVTAVERQVAGALRKPRLLSPKESKQILFPNGNEDLFYIPVSLNTPETAVYRGFSLPDLESLENIAKNGLELNKIQNAAEYAIFASHKLKLAFHYSLPRPNEKASIPVIVKIPITKQCEPMGYNGHFVFVENVAAEYISEIMAFLEMDGKATWYKVTWQEGKMVLTAAPSQQFTANELMIHYLQAWPINLDMD